MSKSCDSITAAKMLAKARAENSGHARINQNFSKSIERQIDVYSKTKEDIRKILNLAKVGSIKDRVSLFDNLKDLEPEPVDPEKKAEAIRMEIVNARAQAQRAQSQESDSDTEIEFQAPIESKVKPVMISRKPSMSEKTQSTGSSSNTLRINQSAGNQDSPRRERRPSIEDLPSVRTKIKSYIDTTTDEEKPKPILKNEKERSRSPRKSTKAPKLLGDHFLSPNQSVQIYAQSATDMSATEDECETSRREPVRRKLSVVLAEQPEPGPVLLQVPPKPSAEARPGIMKSKSFASSSGQYECSIDESSGKKMQMMAFFGQGGGEKQQPQKTVRIKERQVRSSSITDEIMGEEEDIDIDAEFESLLNKTFEKESRRLMTAEESEKVPGQRRRSRDEKAAKQSREDSAGSQTRRGGRGTVSLDMSNAATADHFQQHLRKSNSISSGGSGLLLQRGSSRDESSASAVSSEVGGGTMYPSPVIRQKNFDPVGSLPTSSGRREAHSPSPTQSKPGLRLAMGSPPCSPLASPASPNTFRSSPASPNSFTPASPNSFRSSPGFSQSPISSPGRSSAAKQASPFARFRQLEDQASKSNPGSLQKVQRSVIISPVSPMPGGTSLYRNSSLPASPRPTNLATPATAARSGSGAKEMILMWVQNRLKDYPIPMTNFSTCWNDGLAFCALIHVFYPDNFDWYALDGQNRRHNFTLGFDKAEELAGIYPLLEVDDMVKFKKPDWKCVFTYVQSFYRRFRDGRSPPPKPGAATASSSTGGQAPLSEVALACIASQEAENRGKEIARQIKPIDASHQIVKRQTEVSGEDTNKETKTAEEDVKTKVEEGQQTTPKEEIRKKKNKARPAPLKNLALIRHEDDVQSSGSQTQPSPVGNEETVEEKKNEDIVDDKEKDNEEDKGKSVRPKMPSQPPPPVSL